jgi:hypothetical protein
MCLGHEVSTESVPGQGALVTRAGQPLRNTARGVGMGPDDAAYGGHWCMILSCGRLLMCDQHSTAWSHHQAPPAQGSAGQQLRHEWQSRVGINGYYTCM